MEAEKLVKISCELVHELSKKFNTLGMTLDDAIDCSLSIAAGVMRSAVEQVIISVQASEQSQFEAVQSAIERQGLRSLTVSPSGIWTTHDGSRIVGIGNTLAEALARKYSDYGPALDARREEMEKNLEMPA